MNNKKIAWHLELTLLRRRMRRLHDGAPPEESQLGRGSTRPAELASGLAPLSEGTAFSELH